MARNYAAEARIAQRLTDGGVREVEIETFLIEYRERKYEESEVTPVWFEQQKKAHPVRFIGGTDAEDELHRRAFVEMNVTAQGQCVKRYGLAATSEIAERFNTKIGSTKPGTDPNDSGASAEDIARSRNPWMRPNDPQAKAERLRLIAKMPTRHVAGLAAAAGMTLDCRPLKKRA